MDALSDLGPRDAKKMIAHGKQQSDEAKRIKKAFGVHNVAAHAAAMEYLGGVTHNSSKNTTTKARMSLEAVALKHGTTVSMVRTAIGKQTQPFNTKKVGRPAHLNDADLQDLGHLCMYCALDDHALLKEDLRQSMLKLVNVGRQGRGEEPFAALGDGTYNAMRKQLTEYWARLGVDIIVRKKTETVESCRRKAEKYAIPAFMATMERLQRQSPSDFNAPENWMNLDEQALCDKGSKGKKQTSVQAPGVTGGLRGSQAVEKPPPPATLVSVTFGDGFKAPPIFFRKGKTPMIMSWFTYLPPGLTMDDVMEANWAYGDSDRMTFFKFLDVLENIVFPLHKKRASGKIYWVFDAPTSVCAWCVRGVCVVCVRSCVRVCVCVPPL